MRSAPRDKLEQYLRNFNDFSLSKAMSDALTVSGTSFLTDEQIEFMVSRRIQKERVSARLHRQNREIRKIA